MKNTFDKVKKIEEDISSNLDSDFGKELVEYFSSKLDLPTDICNQYIKQKISFNYNFKLSKYRNSNTPYSLVISFIKNTLFLILAFVLSSRKKIEPKKYNLLIDGLKTENELARWEKLEDLFYKENTIYIAKQNFKNIKNKNILYRKNLKKYSRKLIFEKSIKTYFKDSIFLFLHSYKLKLNLFHLNSYFLNDYFYYLSIFNAYKADFLIQDRNLGGTNALRNYLFKSSGGKASCCIQKNIVQHDEHALFFDTDIFFSYGDKTSEDLIELGARVEKIYPVGSFALENSSYFSYSEKKDLDILYIGINASTSNRTDWKGYYQSIKWLAEAASNFKDLNFSIKHHPSWKKDEKELSLIDGKRINYFNKNLDSYEIAKNFKLIITYGSSMGYELLGLGMDVIFLDPDSRNPFLNRFVHNNNIVIKKYEDLENKLKNIRQADIKENRINRLDFCYDNQNVSKIIFNILNEYLKKK